MTRILVSRPDRIGDVILSTPVLSALKRHYPASRITFLVREEVAPLVSGLPDVDELLIFDPAGLHQGPFGMLRLSREIRKRGIEIAIALQSRAEIATAIFMAGVGTRVGPRSKLHSFLLYNRGIRQKRSSVRMHEVEYGLQLLEPLGIPPSPERAVTKVHLSVPSREGALQWLRARGCDPLAGTVVVVHPGMGGSALNWPEAHYLGLIRELAALGHSVVVTAGPREGALLERFKKGMAEGAARDRIHFYGGAEAGTIERLGGLISWAALVVAPSTGPLHLAVALGRPVLSFYPPIRVQSVQRWGPYASDPALARALVPVAARGQDFACQGKLCHDDPCMESITVAQALAEARQLLSLYSTSFREPIP